MYILAHIDQETKICLGIIRTKENIESDNVVNLEVYDITIIGKKWNGTDWEEVPQPDPLPPIPEQEPIQPDPLPPIPEQEPTT